MKRNQWQRQRLLLPLLALLIALALGLGLKQYYSGAADDQPLWLLSATVGVFESVSGLGFRYQPGVGYLSMDERLLIYRGCSGLNAFVLAIWLVALVPLSFGLPGILFRESPAETAAPALPTAWLLGFYGLGLPLAFACTLMANAARMQSLLILDRVVPGILHPGVPHLLVGSFVYLVFLIVFFLSLRLSYEWRVR